MYGDWLVVRDKFKKLLDSQDSAQTFLDYIEKGNFVPCFFIGEKSHWVESIKYSFYGELGYTLWGASAENRSNISSILNRYDEIYFGEDKKRKDKKNDTENKNKIEIKNDKILVALLRTKELGIIGFGVVTDITKDAMRNFKGWKEGDKVWIVRFRIKIFWLHESIRKNYNDSNKWVGEDYKLEGVNNQSNQCYTEDNNDAVKAFQQFILSKKEEIRSTLEFYSKFRFSTQKEYLSEEVVCNKNAQIDLNGFYIPQDSVNIILKALQTTNVLLAGPPGTGKTSLAIRTVRALTGNNDNCYEVATANSLWFRRNLIGGESIREGSVMWKSGLFIEAYVNAARIKDGNYYVVIDELNRADVDKAFGELMTIFSTPYPSEWSIPNALIEEIKSYGDNIDNVTKSFLEIYEKLKRESRENEPLKRIRIIATINLVDARNLFYVGDALARRFVIIYFDYPKETEDLDEFLKTYASFSEDFKNKVKDLVKYLRVNLNEKEDKVIKFNISPASLKTALDIYSRLDDNNSDIYKFVEVLRSTIGTLNPDNINKFNRLIEKWKKEKGGQ
ncbi:McrB family protein [Saccharolobus solfataricus]|uniref:Restriction endonuclease related protein n=2 Tax=Saccharolobus solfataricus TaxID=2287 RepID=Q97YJ5_SACS2|nr:McrB family protein [Saccharolobus solfataricus]AAK41564.1 Restriction endonuclease related protein [Saccharolobus solfataricus P2]QPG48972.1 McrB family protein [Saccharolobus solfataricus]SAI84994.1 ATPase AAA [Saccharolobus solfataricus]